MAASGKTPAMMLMLAVFWMLALTGTSNALMRSPSLPSALTLFPPLAFRLSTTPATLFSPTSNSVSTFHETSCSTTTTSTTTRTIHEERVSTCLMAKKSNTGVKLSTDGSGRGIYIFALVFAACLWIFTIPPSFRRALICPSNPVCLENRASCNDCVTSDEWTSGIKEYYKNGGGIKWDFTIDPKTKMKQPARRITIDPSSLSSKYDFPVTPIQLTKQWPEQPPFQPEDFDRVDPSNDSRFYSIPKLVYHIDELAVASLTQYYNNNIPDGSDILDICSSWVSHYPLDFPARMGTIYGTGINRLELQLNDQLTGGYVATDLNAEPKLPYNDASLDVVTCVVSIDYLIHPIETLQEVHRVLRPGGKVIISQSNRYFPTKAIAMWINNKNDDDTNNKRTMNDQQKQQQQQQQHLELIDAYFQYAGGFEPRSAFGITAAERRTDADKGHHDPIFAVQAVKK